MRHIFFLITLLAVLCSCNHTTNHIPTAAYKDTIVKDHLQYIETVGEYDTTDLNYKVLKAYVKNDTAYFRKLQSDIEENKRFRKQWEVLDSCIHQPKVQELNADKAYRFIYNSAFCPYRINITISKSGDSSNLHFILYQFKWDTASCRIISEYNKPLTDKNWEDFTEAIQKADFWGLKKENGLHGLDGDDIKVWGFEKGDTAYNRQIKFNYVERWLTTKSSLADPFHLLLKLSGNKKGCIWVQ